MKERPILFSAPMVQALRAGTKTQTRRTRGLDKINEEPEAWRYHGFNLWSGETEPTHKFMCDGLDHAVAIRCPYGIHGDRLWCRENWNTIYGYDSTPPRDVPEGEPVWFSADGKCPWLAAGKTRPGMFMPRWASRDTLELVSVRPERLQEITESDAIAEGVSEPEPAHGSWCDPLIGREGHWSYRKPYASLWESINGPGSWAKNEWAWRLEFLRLATDSTS